MQQTTDQEPTHTLTTLPVATTTIMLTRTAMGTTTTITKVVFGVLSGAWSHPTHTMRRTR